MRKNTTAKLFVGLFLIYSLIFITNSQASPAQANPAQANTVFSITASFTPNNIMAGDSTTFFWQVNGADPFTTCVVSNVPGLSNIGLSGSFTFSAVQDIAAVIVCENSTNGIAFGFAGLNVTNSVPSPTLSISFTPSAITLGETSRLSWSSQNADSCTVVRDDGVPLTPFTGSINNTNGTVFITPTNTGILRAIATCHGPNESISRTALLTTSNAPQPGVNAFYSPNFLPEAGFTTLVWSSFNTDSCFLFGFGAIATSGAMTRFVFDDEQSLITCSGPGGQAVGFAEVIVGQPGIGRSTNPNNQEPGSVMTVTDDLYIKDSSPNPDPALDRVILESLGIQLPSSETLSLAADLNADGSEDRLVLSPKAQTLLVLISNNGEFLSVDKVVTGIGSYSQLESMVIDQNGVISIKLKP